MPAQPARFLFDLDMGHRPERNAVLSESAIAELVAEARRDAYAEGLAAGERTAAARAQQQLAAAAESLADHATALLAAKDEAQKQAIAEAVTLATTIARKLAGHLIAREPTAEIEALVAECLSTLDGVPHLVIRCEPSLADAVRDLATERMSHSGFTGRLVVLGDPDVTLGDARIEWADGGVVRDIRQLSAAVDARVAEYFAARGITPAQETSQ